MTRSISPLLWAIVLINVALTLVNVVFPGYIPIPILILMPLPFVLLHGALRYKWSGIITFVVISLVVSNLLENSSILTGFPFGHYYYTDLLGPKLFVLTYVVGGPNMTVTDAANVTWQTRNIAEAAATVSIFTMLFAVALSAVKVLQGSTVAASIRVEAETPETARLQLETAQAQHSE